MRRFLTPLTKKSQVFIFLATLFNKDKYKFICKFKQLHFQRIFCKDTIVKHKTPLKNHQKTDSFTLKKESILMFSNNENIFTNLKTK